MLGKVLKFGFFFFCFSSLSYGQNGVIQGRIIDGQTKEEIIGAVVKIENTDFGTVSDIDGSFVISGVREGKYTATSSFYAYNEKTIENVVVQNGDTTFLEITLEVESENLEGVKIVAKVNRESENVLLLDQKNAVVATQSVGAAELSRKGIGDAEGAVTSVSGISKQSGVKNVFVRGLGDRYNATLLNGLPVPSEDPEYKNIALSFFESDIIKNIGVDKVFSAQNVSEVGGAIINVNSKELYSDYSLNLSVSTGFNSRAIGTNYIKPDGLNYFGYAKTNRPEMDKFNFANSLDPSQLKLPMNESYKLSGGKKFMVKNNPLSFYAVATHSSDYSYTEEVVRNITTDGTVYQDQIGKKYSGRKSQLMLANVNYNINRSHSIAYNFMMLHATTNYVGEYTGLNAEKLQDADEYMGFVRRQQINDNRLFVHQLLSSWKLAEKWTINIDGSANQIKGFEPDRRENYLSKKEDGTYGLTGSNRQKRFFSELEERDYNAKFALNYKLKDVLESNNSKISVGYSGHFSTNAFEATEYNYSAINGKHPLDNLQLDEVYNPASFDNNRFSMTESYPSNYVVTKNNHSAYISASYQVTKNLSGIVGFKYDYVDMTVAYDVPGRKGQDSIKSPFYLPSVNLKYDINDKNSLRFGASKTYTLPQAKEISPYQYVNISFTSEGNPNIKYSDNYNLDLKWDYYLSPSEIISAGVFYKRIINPIGRVDKGNSAGLLTYDNIGKFADVAGVEIEFRKDLFKKKHTELQTEHKLSFGVNFSYIHTSTKLNLMNTPERISALEGASPFIVNSDLTYRFAKDKKFVMTSLVFNYFSDRIYTVGTMGFQNIVERGIPTMDFVVSGKLGKRVGLKLKVANLLDPSFRLTREVSATKEIITLNQYKKGVNVSLGVSFDL